MDPQMKLGRLAEKQMKCGLHARFLENCAQKCVIPKGLQLKLKVHIGSDSAEFQSSIDRLLDKVSIEIMERITDEQRRQVQKYGKDRFNVTIGLALFLPDVTSFVFNLLGCVILGVGIWVRVNENFSEYVDNSNHFAFLYTGAYLFIVVGILIMIVGSLGCCGAVREDQCMLGLFFALVFIIFCILLGAGILAVVAQDKMKDKVNKALKDGVKDYFNEASPHRTFMDIVQNDFKCCGATKGGEDYGAGDVAKVEACNRYTRPCNEQLFEFVKVHLFVFAGVAIGVAVVLILGMIFSLILCCALRDTQID